jgi:hypothetical protein
MLKKKKNQKKNLNKKKSNPKIVSLSCLRFKKKKKKNMKKMPIEFYFSFF